MRLSIDPESIEKLKLKNDRIQLNIQMQKAQEEEKKHKTLLALEDK